MIDFPASPTNGQVFISGGQSWTYDGTKWVAAGNAVMPPLATGDNRIINGDMRIDQRNSGALVTPISGDVLVDRWKVGVTQTGKFKSARIGPSAVTSPFGFPYFLQLTSQSAYTPLTADAFYIEQRIEGDMLADFLWGTANAQPVTLSFWANATIAGTYSGALVDAVPGTRSYPFTFTLAATGLQKVVIVIPGDTAGPWATLLNGNTLGLRVIFDLGTGTTYRGPANAWTSAYYVGVTSSVSIVANNAAIFSVTGVKLEIGSVATPYNRQTMAKSLADCQRYFSITQAVFMGNCTTGFTYYAMTQPPVTMRIAPAITAVPTGSVSGFPNAVGSLAVSGTGMMSDGRVSNATTSGALFYTTFSASAEL